LIPENGSFIDSKFSIFDNQFSVKNHLLNYFNYFTEIEETFIRRRGKHLLLSPLDWALIGSWQEREIPLKIVLRGIENVFDVADKNLHRTRSIKSLTYCKEEVEAQFTEWQESQVGKSKSDGFEEKIREDRKSVPAGASALFEDETIIEHLRSACDAIDVAKEKSVGEVEKVLEDVSLRLKEFEKTKIDTEKLEKSLGELEDLIDKTLLESYEPNTIADAKNKVEESLMPHKSKMGKDAYQKTFDLMLIKNLREQAEIPRLSLFYL